VIEPITREALFISHATPGDNAFARWLGAKLAAMGYEVWADVLSLHGGADWSRELEGALRTRATKMLLVCTPIGLDKQGVRNEIEIGAELAQELGDREFIIPLRLAPFKAPFRIAQAQYVDFSKTWAAGLAELVDLLVNIHKVPQRPGRPMGDWMAAQRTGAARLVERSEHLTSNWLALRKLPSFIRYFERRDEVSLEQFQDRTLYAWPVLPFGGGVLSFGHLEGLAFSPTVSAREICKLPISNYLDEGWDRLEISAYEARRQFSDLANQAFESFLQNRGLTSYEGSRGRRVWWGDIRTLPLAQVRFGWRYQHGRRQIIGLSEKRGIHWHYAVSAQVRTAPVRHLRLSAHLIFSENGLNAIEDDKRMHRLRRSFAKSWRNARWRDMQLAFLWWLAGGLSALDVPVSRDDRMRLTLPPVSFKSPVSAQHIGDAPPDEDDPDVEFDDWDDFSSEATEDVEDP
jgi:hypothetical protein